MRKRVKYDRLVAAVREHGLRATPARIATLSAVIGANRPVSHADIVRSLGTPDIDRATVFRNLATLARVGLLRRIDIGDRVWRFVESGPRDAATDRWGARFECTRCGAVTTLRDVQLHVPMRGAPRAITRREVDVVVHGRCNACASGSP